MNLSAKLNMNPLPRWSVAVLLMWLASWGVWAAGPRLYAPARLNPLSTSGPLNHPTGVTPGQFEGAAFAGWGQSLPPNKVEGVSTDSQGNVLVRMGGSIGGGAHHSWSVQGQDLFAEPVLGADGTETVLRRNMRFGRVARPFPLRLILHEDSAGLVRLLQRVYLGLAGNGEEGPAVVLTTREDALDFDHLDSARRISSAHLPHRDANTAWTFSGSFEQGGTVSCTVTVNYADQAANPFLHTYHPDHDNKDAEFKKELPRGIESYTVERVLKLTFTPPGDDFDAVTRGATQWVGDYEETMTFKAKDQGKDENTIRVETKSYDVRGRFVLNRIIDIDTLVTTAP